MGHTLSTPQQSSHWILTTVAKEENDGAGKTAQQLGAPWALSEDPGSNPGTHWAAFNCLELQLQGT